MGFSPARRPEAIGIQIRTGKYSNGGILLHALLGDDFCFPVVYVRLWCMWCVFGAVRRMLEMGEGAEQHRYIALGVVT